MTNTTNDIIAADNRRAAYGVNETNGLESATHTHETVDWNRPDTLLDDPELASINRLRLLTERGYPYYDISYCYGTLKDGTHVRVNLLKESISRRNAKGELIALAKAAGRNAKALGLLDEYNTWSVLRG